MRISIFNPMRKLFFVLFFLNIYLLVGQQADLKTTDFLVEGKYKLFYRDFNASISLFEKALENSLNLNDYPKISETYNMLSKAYSLNSRHDLALSYAKKALTYSRYKNLESRNQEAIALDNVGNNLAIMGNFKDAEENHNNALKIRLEYLDKDAYGFATSYFNLGSVLRRQHDFESALSNLQKALSFELLNTPESKILHANINEEIGYLYYDQGNFSNALAFFEKTHDLAKDVYENNNTFFVKVFNELGLVYSIREQFNESLKYYRKALSVSISNYGLDRHPDQAKIHYNMGTIYRRQNQKDQAIYHTQKCLEMAKRAFGENHTNLFFPYSQMGQIYGDEKGIPYIKKALDICEKSKTIDYLRISYLYDYLYEIYFNISNESEALKYAKKALELRLKMAQQNNANTVRSYNTVSKTYLALENHENALLFNRQALNSNYLYDNQEEILTKTFKSSDYLDDDSLLESVKIRADICLSLYYKNKDKEQLKMSNVLYKRAVLLINSLRNKSRNYDDKIRFSSIVKSVFAKSIETNLLINKLNNDESTLVESFYFSEKSRANVLRELSQNTEVKKISNISTEVIDLEKSINQKISDLTSDVIKEGLNKERDTVKIYELEGMILDLSRSKDSLEKAIEANFPKYYRLKYEKPILGIRELQRELDENTTLIEFFNSEDIIYAFVITKDTFHIEELSIENLEQTIENLNLSIVNKEPTEYLGKANDLYNQLIKPIKNHLVGDKLIIIPDESLWNLQFDLLVTEEKEAAKPSYLLYDYAISYANSASMLFEKDNAINESDLLDECIAFSYTKSDSISKNSKVDLPGSRKEIQELSKIFDVKSFNDYSANETNFKQNVDKFKLVHLALHAEIDSLNQRNLKIFFADDGLKNDEDNQLFGHELYTLNIPANLVVLSACNTGIGKVNKGEGILSLGNAFQYAGAKSLLLSRWKISDDTTPEVMKLFYKNLKKGMLKSKALQTAKIEYLKDSDYFTAQPFYWGSFYVLGNTDAIEFDNNSVNIYYYVFAVLLTLFLLYIRRK